MPDNQELNELEQKIEKALTMKMVSDCIFAQKAFTIIEPGTPFEYNWHLDCIAEHLQAQAETAIAWEGQED